MAEHFAQSFLAISDPAERLWALQKLLDKLSFDERQAVDKYLHLENDIVSRLPIELLLHVFSYLGIVDVVRLQLVNKQWREKLSSNEAMQSMLARWNTHSDDDGGLSIDILRNSGVVERLNHFRTFWTCKPAMSGILEDVGPITPVADGRLCRIELKHDKIAYISSTRGSDSVIVRSLAEGTTLPLAGHARERIMSLVLTISLVAFVTFDGCLYVSDLTQDLSPGPLRRLLLPSACVRATAADRDTIVIALGGGAPGGPLVSSIVVYKHQTKTMRSFRTASDPNCMELENELEKTSACALLITASGNRIDLFTMLADSGNHEIYGAEKPGIVVTNRSFTCDGKMISADHCEIAPKFARRYKGKALMVQTHSTGYRDDYRIVGMQPQQLELHLCDVYFNTGTGAFTAHSQQLRHCHFSMGHSDIALAPTTRLPYLHWKNLAMTLRSELETRWQVCACVMNETFFVSLEMLLGGESAASRVQVFSFDERAPLRGMNKLETNEEYSPCADSKQRVNEVNE